DQRALRAEAAQADGGRTGTAAVVNLRVGAVHVGRQALDNIAQSQLASVLDGRGVDGDDRVGRFDIHATDIRTGHYDGFEGLALLLIGGLRLGSKRTGRGDRAERQAQPNRRRKFIHVESHYILQTSGLFTTNDLGQNSWNLDRRLRCRL